MQYTGAEVIASWLPFCSKKRATAIAQSLTEKRIGAVLMISKDRESEPSLFS